MAESARTIRNRVWLNQYKVEQGCVYCGYNSHPSALQLDHIDPETKYKTKNGKRLNPGELVRYSQAILFAEVRKCRVLCANCHAVHTHTVQRTPVLDRPEYAIAA
jgi:hypothetical protein